MATLAKAEDLIVNSWSDNGIVEINEVEAVVVFTLTERGSAMLPIVDVIKLILFPLFATCTLRSSMSKTPVQLSMLEPEMVYRTWMACAASGSSHGATDAAARAAGSRHWDAKALRRTTLKIKDQCTYSTPQQNNNVSHPSLGRDT